jgi:hypothetical protein
MNFAVATGWSQYGKFPRFSTQCSAASGYSDAPTSVCLDSVTLSCRPHPMTSFPWSEPRGAGLLGAVGHGFPRFVQARRCIEAAKFCQNEVGVQFPRPGRELGQEGGPAGGMPDEEGQRGLDASDQCDGRGDARVKNLLLAVVPEPAGIERDHGAVVPSHCQLDHYAGTMELPRCPPRRQLQLTAAGRSQPSSNRPMAPFTHSYLRVRTGS